MKNILLILFTTASLLTAEAQTPKSREHYLNEVKYYSEKIKQEPLNISNYYLRATFYHVLTNFQASTADFKKVLEIYMRNPTKKYEKVATDACYFLADDYYFRNSDRTSAQSYINWGLSITPGDKRFEVLQTGIMGSYPEKAEEAGKKFESLIAKYPNDDKLALYYAKFLERKDLKKSMQYYQKVVSLSPNNIHALFALGSFYVNEASGIYKTTGDARKCMDLSKKAIAYFEKVHLLNPDDKEIIEILIQSYGNLNMDDERKKMEKKLER